MMGVIQIQITYFCVSVTRTWYVHRKTCLTIFASKILGVIHWLMEFDVHLTGSFSYRVQASVFYI